uniref:p7.41 n=1 Tax=Trichoplusia ni granulosis virus TaxID=10462 RepID=O71115_GVTN|nr:p7.41 [Trichoplusia ni granulovirus]
MSQFNFKYRVQPKNRALSFGQYTYSPAYLISLAPSIRFSKLNKSSLAENRSKSLRSMYGFILVL